MNLVFFYLRECKFRLFYILLGFLSTFLAICLEIQPVLYHVLKPLNSSTIVITDLLEYWHTMLSLSFFFSFIVSSVFFFYNLWAFFSPGLYLRESSFFFYFFYWNFFLSVSSLFVSFYFIVPFLVDFLFYGHKSSIFVDIHCFPKLYSFTCFLTQFLFYLFLFMQFPGFFCVLLQFNIISPCFFFRYRKYVYVFVIFVSALMSPPEIVTQFLASIFLVFFYEVFVFFSYWYKVFMNTQAQKIVIKNL